MSTATVPNVSKALAQEFEEIFREHCQFVYRTAYSVTGNRPDAEDVLQNIFVKLLQREFPSDLMRAPRAYLYRAAINLSLNVVRSRRNQRLSGDVDLLEATALAPIGDEQDDLQRRLMDAVAQLKPQAVQMLILRYTHGYSDAQIARMLGKSRGTIAVTLYRARKRLQQILRSEQEMSDEHR